jgi:hypothetical protein
LGLSFASAGSVCASALKLKVANKVATRVEIIFIDESPVIDIELF